MKEYKLLFGCLAAAPSFWVLISPKEQQWGSMREPQMLWAQASHYFHNCGEGVHMFWSQGKYYFTVKGEIKNLKEVRKWKIEAQGQR